jgi:hypothetical protein
VQNARLGREEELGALKRLDDQARRLERHANGPSVEQLIAEERRQSRSYGGRSVYGWEPAPAEGEVARDDHAPDPLRHGRGG